MLSLSGFGVPAAATGIKSSSASDPNHRGFEELSQCLGSHSRVDALYVMDVSGSLTSNDPTGERFEALEASVSQLGVLAQSGSLDVHAAVSTFGNAFSGPAGVQDWTKLPASRSATGVAEQFRSSAEKAWQAAGTNQGTDYQAAVSGARQALRERGSQADACQVMFWFTDGLFSLGDPYDASRTNAASDEMCSPAGLIDQVRRDQISIVALALTGGDVEAQLKDPAYAQRRGELAAMARGRAPGKVCGTLPIPDSSRAGVYLSAHDPTALGAIFSGVAAQASGCAPSTLRTTLPANVDVQPGVRKFQVDVSTGGVTGAPTITAPNGASTSVKPGTTKSFQGGTIDVTESGSLTSVVVRMPGSGVPGMWRVALGESRDATSVTVYRCTDLNIDFGEPAGGRSLQGGSPAAVPVFVRDASGAADLRDYRTDEHGALVGLGAEGTNARDVAVTVKDLAKGELTVQFTPTEATLSADITVQFTPELKSAPDTQLSQVTGSKAFAVAPPTSFPTLEPSTELDLGSTEGLGAATGTLHFVGSKEGATQVCIDSATGIDAPASAGKQTVTTSAHCIDLAPGQKVDVDVAAAPEKSAEGSARADLPVTLTNTHSQKIKQNVVVRWELKKQIDQGRRRWLLILAGLIALLIPLLVLMVVNRWLARFEKGNIRYAIVESSVSDDGALSLETSLTTDDLSMTYLEGAALRESRMLSAAGLSLAARAPWSPLGSPRFQAIADAGSRVVGENADLVNLGARADVTAGLGGLWLLGLRDSEVQATPPDQPLQAQLVIVTRGEGPEHLATLIQRAQTALSDGRGRALRQQLIEIVGDPPPQTGLLDPGRGTPGERSADDDDDPFGPLDVDPTADLPRPSAPPRSRRSRRSQGNRTDPSEDSTPADADWDDPFS